MSVSIHILKLVDINEDDYSIEIQFEITLRWKEIRATFYNLKEAESLNALSQDDVQRLWLPKVVYENTDQKETTRLGEFGNGEWETNVVVRRIEGKGTMSQLDTLDETMIFSGNKNEMVMRQTYTHTFQCPYQLSAYPFDTQVRGFEENLKTELCTIFFQKCALLRYACSKHCAFIVGLRNKHGHGVFGFEDCESCSWPAEYEPRGEYADISCH